MSVTVWGEGPDRCDVMIVGERPGHEEAIEGRPFVGPSGVELFGGFDRDGMWHVGHWPKWVKVPRREVYVTNLVKTFRNYENPEPWEVDRWAGYLSKELATVRPRVIVTMGAWAMRWFLGDKPAPLTNGIPHYWTNGGPDVEPSIVVPCIHPAAALREMESQPDLVFALQQVRRVIENTLRPARPLRPLSGVEVVPIQRLGLGGELFVDTEGTLDDPQAITVQMKHRVALVYCDNAADMAMLQVHFDNAALAHERTYMHWAVHDLQVLWAAGLRVDGPVGCTMLEAFICHESQSLKNAMYRRFATEMGDFEDLVAPYDKARVERALRRWRRGIYRSPRYTSVITTQRISEKTGKVLKPKVTPTPIAKELRKVVRSITGILEKPSDDATARKRWTTSTVLMRHDGPPPAVTWKETPTEEREPYALADPWATAKLHQSYTVQMRADRTTRIHRIDRDTIPLLARMEHVGMRVDTEKLHALSQRLGSRVEGANGPDLTQGAFGDVARRIFRVAGVHLNPLAADDCADLLFGDLKVTPTKRSKKTGRYSTEDKYLEARKHEHPVIPLIIEGREIWKMKTTCEQILDAVVYEDETHYYILYPNLKYTRVVSGRLSAEDPNVLALPKHSAWGQLIRACFVARKRMKLLSNDLSQIELRTAAHVSKDDALCKAFIDGIDLHAKTAHEVLGAPKRKEDQDESLHRLPSKTTNFSVLMGVTGFGLADTINEALAVAVSKKLGRIAIAGEDYKQWTPDEGADLIKGWYKLYPGVKDHNKRRLQDARRTGYVTDMWGRRRYVGGVLSSNKWVREAAEREVQSYPYQAGAKGLMKIWQARIWQDVITPRHRDGVYCEPWLDVHDDQILEARSWAIPSIATEINACIPQLFRVPVLGESKAGLDWGSLHKV